MVESGVRIPEGAGASLRLRVPPDARYSGYVRLRVLGFSRNARFPEADGAEFVSAVSEALANAIEHSRSTESIDVACWLVGRDQLIATVVDHGIGFAAREAAENVRLPEPYAERGRGLPIMRHFSDLFSLRSIPGQGTSVLLGRYLRPAQAAGSAAAGD